MAIYGCIQGRTDPGIHVHINLLAITISDNIFQNSTEIHKPPSIER